MSDSIDAEVNPGSLEEGAVDESLPTDPLLPDQSEEAEVQPEPIFEAYDWDTSLICRFCREGDIDRLRFFVDFSQQMASLAKYAAELADRLDTDSGLAPLHHAARYQHLEICVLLLTNIQFVLGVNIKDENGRTPIHSVFRSSQVMAPSQGKLRMETDFGNQIQDYEAWQKEYTEKVLTSDHPLIYLFARVNGDVNAQDKYLLTPLHYAVARNNLPGVKQLITCHAEVEVEDRQGMRPLHVACREGYRSIAEYLLIQVGAQVDATDADDWTPVHHACAKGHLEIVQLIRTREKENFPDLLRMETNTEATCIHLAVQSGNLELVKYILDEFPVNVMKHLLNQASETLGTPLHIAAKFCDPQMVNYLYHRGANPSIANHHGQTALHLATQSNRLDIVRELLQLTQKALLEIQDEHGRTALSCTTDPDVLDALIQGGADISTQDHEQMNPLMIAVRERHIHIVERYLSTILDRLGTIADHVEKTNGCSVFLIAIETGSIELCSLLLKHPDIRWDTTNRQRMNAFHLAARRNHDQLINYLCHRIPTESPLDSDPIALSSGLNQFINATDEDGRSPLHIAAEYGHTASVEILLKYGANVLLSNHLGQIPLFTAVQHGHTASAKLLIEASIRFSADLQSYLSRRQSPLIVACQNGYADLAQLLISHEIGIFDGLDPEQSDAKNPLEVAIDHRQRETVHVLLNHPHSEYWLQPIRKTSKTQHQTPLREMIQFMPDCAKHAFDRFIIKSIETDSPEEIREKTVYQYKLIDDYFINENKLYSDKSRELYRNHPFIIALDHGHHFLLDHPLAQKLMLRKWHLYRPIYYYPRVSTFLLLFLLTVYGLIAPAPQLKKPPSSPDDDILTRIFHLTANPMCWVIVVLSIFNLVKIFSEIILFRGFRAPFAQLFGITSYLLAIIAFAPRDENADRIIPPQWQFNSIAILFQWFNVAVILRSTPSLGYFLVMLESIFVIFIRIVLVMSPLLIAFTISTHMVFFNQPSFATMLTSIHKATAMLVGELDYQQLFFSKPTLSAANLIFLPFVLMMTVVFMNFLLGMTVGTISYTSEKVRAKANAYWIREMIFIESILPHQKWLKSNILQSETSERVLDNTMQRQSSEQTDDDDERFPLHHPYSMESRKLLDILDMLCTQAKQTLDYEMNLEQSLKSLLETNLRSRTASIHRND